MAYTLQEHKVPSKQCKQVRTLCSRLDCQPGLASTLFTFESVGSAGAEEGAASLTANLVDLGYTNLVVGIVLNLIDRERSDIVVKVSLMASVLLLYT